MIDSVRARLTLWYTGVLALVLVIFSVLAYAFVAHSTRQRTDDSLHETADSVAASFAAEYKDDEGRTSDWAAVEAAREFRFSDQQVLIYDEAGQLVASSNSDQTSKSTPAVSSSLVLHPSSLLETAARTGSAYATLPDGEEGVRAFAMIERVGQRAYTVVVATSQHDQEEALAEARDALYIAVPLALLLASLGGYFLARKSLAPVVAMSEQAAHIGAANLHERLAVHNERDELGRLAQVFNELLARLDNSFHLQRRFMADASHELRTPIAIICGEAEVTLSRDERAAEDYCESLSIVQDEGRRLKRIVEDLFLLARADAGQYPLSQTDFYLDELINECVRAVRTLAATRGVKLFCEPTIESPMRGDEGLMQRMILNLLDNAIKHTPAQGTVTVRLARDGTEYLITVTDTGQGISTEEQPHIFERFYRVDKARGRGDTDGGSGAGLGLSIARWVAEVHHGRLELLRSDESGSTFKASLPVVNHVTQTVTGVELAGP
jgi:two-component system OmpR family sensor kinase